MSAEAHAVTNTVQVLHRWVNAIVQALSMTLQQTRTWREVWMPEVLALTPSLIVPAEWPWESKVIVRD